MSVLHRGDVRAAALDVVRADLGLRPRRPQIAGGIAGLAARTGRPLDVAVARLDGIGDWVLTLPLVQELRTSPDVRSVTLVGPRPVSGLLGGLGLEFSTLDLRTTFAPRSRSRRFGKLAATAAPAQLAAFRAGRAAAGRFDLVVIPRWQVDRGYNVRAWALGTRATIAGHDPRTQPLAGAKERHEARLLSITAADRRPLLHESDRLRVLSSALGLPGARVHAPGAAFFGVPAFGSVPPAGRLVIHTGASESKRRWPADRWRGVVRAVLDGTGLDVVLIGAPDEREGHEVLLAGLGPRATSRAGEPLSGLPGLLSSADVFVGSDSGPAHIATSIGVPAVVLSCHPVGGDPAHANSPDLIGPRGTTAEVLRPRAAGAECVTHCAHRDPHCIESLTVTDVVTALARVRDASRSALPVP